MCSICPCRLLCDRPVGLGADCARAARTDSVALRWLLPSGSSRRRAHAKRDETQDGASLRSVVLLLIQHTYDTVSPRLAAASCKLAPKSGSSPLADCALCQPDWLLHVIASSLSSSWKILFSKVLKFFRLHRTPKWRPLSHANATNRSSSQSDAHKTRRLQLAAFSSPCQLHAARKNKTIHEPKCCNLQLLLRTLIQILFDSLKA